MQKTFAQKIKEGTVLAHASTEKAMMVHVKRISTTSDYARLLECLYGYFHPLEEKISEFGSSLTDDYHNRRKTQRILNDLENLQISQSISLTTDLPIMNNQFQAIGCLYVLEGSVMGGSILKKRIQAQIVPIPEDSFTYFSAYGPQTGTMWQSFISQFNSYFPSEAELSEAIDSANSCFQKFEQWICDHCKTAVRTVSTTI